MRRLAPTTSWRPAAPTHRFCTSPAPPITRRTPSRTPTSSWTFCPHGESIQTGETHSDVYYRSYDGTSTIHAKVAAFLDNPAPATRRYSSYAVTTRQTAKLPGDESDLTRIYYHEDFAGLNVGDSAYRYNGMNDNQHADVVSTPSVSAGRGVKTWMTGNNSGWGDWGFTRSFPDCGEGAEAWARVWVNIPSGFTWTGRANGRYKFFRFRRRDGANTHIGFTDALMTNNRDLSCGTEGVNGSALYDLSDVTIIHGANTCLECYVRFSSSESGGMIRFWQNGVMIGERKMATMATKPGEHGDSFYFLTHFTNTGGGEPGYAGHLHYDSIAIAVQCPARDDTPHLTTDSAGNRMIGMATL